MRSSLLATPTSRPPRVRHSTRSANPSGNPTSHWPAGSRFIHCSGRPKSLPTCAMADSSAGGRGSGGLTNSWRSPGVRVTATMSTSRVALSITPRSWSAAPPITTMLTRSSLAASSSPTASRTRSISLPCRKLLPPRRTMADILSYVIDNIMLSIAARDLSTFRPHRGQWRRPPDNASRHPRESGDPSSRHPRESGDPCYSTEHGFPLARE